MDNSLPALNMYCQPILIFHGHFEGIPVTAQPMEQRVDKRKRMDQKKTHESYEDLADNEH